MNLHRLHHEAESANACSASMAHHGKEAAAVVLDCITEIPAPLLESLKAAATTELMERDMKREIPAGVPF